MSDKILAFPSRKSDNGDGGSGDLVVTIYAYEHGYTLETPSQDILGTDAEYRRAVRDLMFRTWTAEAEAIHRLTGADEDMSGLLVSILGGGQITRWTGGDINSLARMQWLQHMLGWVSRAIVAETPLALYHDNTNHPPEPKPMKKDLLKTFTRRAPAVLALQILPGVEDNWIAVDDNGNELSRAATIDGVQKAAPNAADYAPILELHGLQGKPLKMGDYVIDDGDGVYFSMPKEQFEELFVEGEDDGEKKGKKADPVTVEYANKKLTPAELLAELEDRDRLTQTLRDELDKVHEELLAKQAEENPTSPGSTPPNPEQTEQSSTTSTDASPTDTPAETSSASSSSTPTSESVDGSGGQASTTSPGETSSATGTAKRDPLDHDGDGKKGGSKPRAKKST